MKNIQAKFIIDPNRQDNGGSLTLTAKTIDAKLQLIIHFKLFGDDAEGLAAVLSGNEPFTYSPKAPGCNNGAWFMESGELPDTFLIPYRKLLHNRTGAAELPDISAESMENADMWNGMHGSFYVHTMFLKGGKLSWIVFVTSQDWNGKKAGERSNDRAASCLKSHFGTTPMEPEFIQTGNGIYVKNPRYATNRPPAPALGCEWFFKVIVHEWLKTATGEQRTLVEVDAALMWANHKGTGGLRNLRYESGLCTSWTGPEIKWEEFQKLGNQ